MGLLNRLVTYEVGNDLLIDLPLYKSDYQFDRHQLLSYEVDLISVLSKASLALPGPLQLVDCRADIGIFSILLASQCPRLERIFAFEPSHEAYLILEANLRRLPLSAEAHRVAVSNFSGIGTLQRPAFDNSDHARFLAPDPNGDVSVRRIDDFGLGEGGGLILKLDVEGGELDALRGAQASLTGAGAFVVAIEANRDVVKRTGIDPIECVRFLHSIRDCTCIVAEEPTCDLDVDRKLLEQLDDRRVHNIVCCSQRTSAVAEIWEAE